ncbi:calnexin-like [Ptychodera flava]|uniref:calnexin-like n=1 Tax=Ptychodera flava TaxID=63121 RepID=UPI00396A3366
MGRLVLLSVFVVTLLLYASIPTVHSQEDDDFEDDMDVEVEEEEEEPAKPTAAPKVYTPPSVSGPSHFKEAFLSVADFNKRWIPSKATKDGVADDISKYDGKWEVEAPEKVVLSGDLGLVLKSRAKHHAISAPLDKPFVFDKDTLIVQYEVQFQNGQDCGGAYIKLLSDDQSLKLSEFHDKTRYTIMFGPDKCGQDSKLHFIFQHKNPKTGEFEEKHAKKPSGDIGRMFTDKKTHLYTLVLKPDNTFEIFVDQASVNSGSLLKDVTPPVNPPAEIDDPTDKKPSDWDDRKKIADPDATKPDDWDEDAPKEIVDPDAEKPEGWLDDEPEFIDDPDAEKPEDWDDDMDGEWEAPKIENPACDPGCGEWNPPMIKNPDYKGKWHAPMIDNPDYKGEWSPRRIPNPDFFEDLEPFKMTSFNAVGLELWSMSDGILFDNFIVTTDKATADEWAEQTWIVKNSAESTGVSGESVVGSLVGATEDRPWLWAVYGLVVIIPIALCFSYLFPKNKAPAHPKKTDAPSPDDEPSKDDESKDEEAEEEEAEDEVDKSAKKPSKADLEATQDEEKKKEDDGEEDKEEDEEAEEEEEVEEEEEEEEDKKEEEKEEGDDDEAKEEETKKEEEENLSPRTRKRKSRKD